MRRFSVLRFGTNDRFAHPIAVLAVLFLACGISPQDQIGAAIGGQGSGSNSDRNKLFAGRGQAPSYAVRSTEADQTRDLDDRGVLQMQRDMIRGRCASFSTMA